MAVALYKKFRRFNKLMSITGWDFLKLKRILLGVEPNLFEEYPPHIPGQPATLRLALSREELEWAAARIRRRELTIPAIALRLGIWRMRLEYLLWRNGYWKPGSIIPLQGEAPDNWNIAWKREYEMTEMKREEKNFHRILEDYLPKISDDNEDEIDRLLKENGML